MEIIFNCKECDQELSVESEAAGQEFNCPNCGIQLVVPEADGAPAPEAALDAPPAPRAFGAVNPIKTSAGAKEEHHFKVPMREHTTPESLIEKPKVPLEVAAKEAFKVRVKTIRHSDCVEVGHDKFDEIVTKFLNQIGDTNVVSLTPVSYQYIEIGSQKVVTDFGVMIVYRTT